jgi:hypothetical protein
VVIVFVLILNLDPQSSSWQFVVESEVSFVVKKISAHKEVTIILITLCAWTFLIFCTVKRNNCGCGKDSISISTKASF